MEHFKIVTGLLLIGPVLWGTLYYVNSFPPKIIIKDAEDPR
jgi:hypothetical protein